MSIGYEEPDDSREDEDVEVLQLARELLSRKAKFGIRGVGPLNDQKTILTIVVDSKSDAIVPEFLELTLSNKKTVTLKLLVKRSDSGAILLAGPVPPPWQYSGPMMGGDPVWNDAATQWGTITFAVGQGSAVEIEGNSCSNQALTCSHVLDFSGSVGASTTRYPGALKVQWLTNPPVGNKWIDVAGADILPGNSFTPLKVRGLGGIKGVRRPVSGMRVSKYGATTGLTSGRDLGWVSLQLGSAGSQPASSYLVRQVSGYFALEGDSGAPVLDAQRNLLGLVLAGNPGAVDETYYIPAWPRAVGPAPANRSYFEISGL